MNYKSDFIQLSIPNLSGNEICYVNDAIKTGWVSSVGEYVLKFENAVCSYIKAKKAAVCQSGTAGLHLSLIVLGIKKNDEVIVPTVSFIATVNPVKYVGAFPVFMDCDDSFCMDVVKLKKFLEEECIFDGRIVKNKVSKRRIKAIIVVHVFGNMKNMCELLNIAKFYNLKIIEDAAEALGSFYKEGKLKGKYAGTMADIGVFSFNGNKIITTGGGGVVVSNNINLINQVKFLSTQAKKDSIYFIHDEIGFNYRMTNVQAAIGLAQIEQIENFIKVKTRNYNFYKECGVNLIPFNLRIRSNYWFYSYLTEERDDLINYLLKNKIQSRPLWFPIHLQKCYKKSQSYKIKKALWFWKRVINLPCSTNLSKDMVFKISTILKKFNKPLSF
ncbi:MAG: LegC family aminotransferase [Oscillospiraceae bacterium]|jgi:aminotransferase in exopolysaccharide biosynthesis|nr:LegC family aminotransferase [Oscillospiraceae bacterium]